MTESRTYSAEFRSGLRATLTVSMQGVNCQWSPDLPRNMELTEHESLIAAYRIWRDECLRDFAREHGLTIHTFKSAGLDAIVFAREAPP
jgi:hypothetical protein